MFNIREMNFKPVRLLCKKPDSPKSKDKKFKNYIPFNINTLNKIFDGLF